MCTKQNMSRKRLQRSVAVSHVNVFLFLFFNEILGLFVGKASIPSAVEVTKPPRPPSAYNNYVRLIRPTVAKEKPLLKNTEIFAEIGARWKSLTDDEKSKFKPASV